MRVLTVIALLSGLPLFSSDAASVEAVAGGTITRLDAETCRVQVWFTWVGEPNYPTPTCNYDYFLYPYAYGATTSLTGAFGTPEQMYPEPLSYGDGYAFWLASSVGGAFNFKLAKAQTDIAISYGVREEDILYMYYCDQSDPCPEPCRADYGSPAGSTLVELGEGSGKVYAEIPQGIGEYTTLREIPVAVTNHTWSQVKGLYR